MPVVDIQCFDSPVLRKKAKKVTRVNKAIKKTLQDMLDTMREANGVGLAAPQIGISKRLVVLDVGDGPRFLVNPEITARSAETEVQWEGCLSWPGYIGEVERSASVTVKALDEAGREVWIEGEGLLARCLQHEIDHLDGILFIDRATTISEVPKETPEEDEFEAEGAEGESGQKPGEASGQGAGDEVSAETPEKAEDPHGAQGPEASESQRDREGRPLTAVFMGSPEFAVPSLEALVKAGVKVRLVVTQPDRPYGRKRIPKPTPVKSAAEKLGIPVLCCENLKDENVQDQIAAIAPDFITVVAFGQKVPQAVIDIPRYACLNVHPSLLPKYRGGNPVSRAILNGERITGVSVIYLSEKLDAGDICLQRETEIGPDETYGELEMRLAYMGAGMLLEAMAAVYGGSAQRIPQNDSVASRARHLRPGEDQIEWGKPAQAVHNLVRGLAPEPGAVTEFGGQRIKVLSTRLTGKPAAGTPGTIAGTQGEALLVNCADQMIAVLKVHPEGKKQMTGKAFMIGRSKAVGAFGKEVTSNEEGGF